MRADHRAGGTLSCEQAALRFWEYLDCELDQETTRRVWEHVRACAACFPHYEFQRVLKAFLRRCGPAAVPEDLRAGVLRMLAEEERAASS